MGIRVILVPLALTLVALLAFGNTSGVAQAGGGRGTLNIAVFGEVQSLDPALADGDASRLVLLNVYDQLFEYDYLARPFELRPLLAASLPKVSDDRLTWTLSLRSDIRFHDDPCFGGAAGGKGRPVTASDVVFCLKRLMDAGLATTGRWVLERRVVGIDAFTAASKKARPNPKRAAYTADTGYPAVDGLKVIDDHTLQIKLVQPYPALPWVLASSFASIYPPEAVAHYGDELKTHIVSSGPYRLQRYISPTKLMFGPVRGYREDRYPSDGAPGDRAAGRLSDRGKALPLNDLIVVSGAPDDMTIWTWFQAGDVDMAVVPRDARWSIVAPDGVGGFQLLESFTKRGVALQDDPYLEIYYEAFNMQDPVLGHPAGEKGLALRRAICLASDDTWTIERLHGGLATPIQGPLLPEFPAFTEHFANPWQRQPDEPLEDALELARETLAEAGMAGGEGVPVIVKDVLDFPSSRMRFERFKKRIAEIGLRFEPNFVSWAELRKRIDAGEARMWNISWRLDYPDPENLLQLFYGPFVPVPNDSRYSNPEFDALYEQALRTAPGDERAMLYEEMQEIAVEDCVYRWRFRRRRLAVTQPWLSNYKFNDIAPRFFRYCRVDEVARTAFRKTLRTKEAAGG